jgi:Asp-tRNA(Asn)/Glu-tRNA(Gln) amidotransferase A subunit family amidase
MEKDRIVRGLRELAEFAKQQSTSPYNNHSKERHVRELFADICAKLERMVVAVEEADLPLADERSAYQAWSDLDRRVRTLEASVAGPISIPIGRGQ